MISLARQLGRGLFVTLAAAFLLLWFLSGTALRELASASIASRLDHDIESLLAVLEWDAEGAPTLPEERIPLPFRRPYSGHYFLIRAGEASIPSRSLWDYSLVAAEAGLTRTVGPQEEKLLLLRRDFRRAEQTITILMAEDLGPLEREVEHFQRSFAGVCVLSLGILLIMQHLLLRRSLRPLATLRDELLAVKRGKRASLDEAITPGELLPLVREINRLLAVVRQRLERSRTALGNLAHLLKTPLACLAQAAGDDTESPGSFRDLVGEQTERLRRLVDRELKRARLAGQETVGGPGIAVAAAAADLLSILGRIHAERGLDLVSRIPDTARFPGDREDLLELLGNLLDNACQWAHHRVVIGSGGNHGLHLTIEDDGPGVDAALLARLNRRG
ncbi:MAG: ATP-binding protein, partial [Magnetococcales bacterium]|nr:ATP-binding protein [Magnetococcales bacterium]